jgi:hypothetical protein
LVGWLVGWLVACLVGWLVGWLAGWLVGSISHCLVGRLVDESILLVDRPSVPYTNLLIHHYASKQSNFQ